MNITKVIKKKIKQFIYFGSNHKCIICNSNVRVMKPSGTKHEIFEKNIILEAGYRDNCVCPVCGSKDRKRLVYYYIKNCTDILTVQNTILHFAPEYEIKEIIMQNKLAKYYDGDIQKGKATYIIDMTNIKFDDNSFDYIICNQVLEHIVDEKKAISELKRVIKPKGKIIITVPICISNEKTFEDSKITDKKGRLENFCQEDHVRLYGRDFKERLEKYGLNVEEWNVNDHFTKKEIKKYALQRGSMIFIASK